MVPYWIRTAVYLIFCGLLVLLFGLVLLIWVSQLVKWEGAEKWLQWAGRGVLYSIGAYLLGGFALAGVVLVFAYGILPWSLNFLLSAIALSIVTTWLFLRFVSNDSEESSEDERISGGIWKAPLQFWSDFKRRLIHIRTMDPPLRLITVSAIAQIATSAILLWAYHTPARAVDVSPIEEQHLQMDWRVFTICVISMVVAWSFVLAGVSRARRSLLLTVALFSFATRPASLEKVPIVLWICLMLVVWSWGLMRWSGNRKAILDSSQSFNWSATKRLLLFLGGSLGGYYLILWILLPHAGKDSFYGWITGQIFNFALFLIPVLFLAGTDLAEVSELGADLFRALIAQSRWLLFGTTGVFSAVMIIHSLRSSEVSDFSNAEGGPQLAALVIAVLILAVSIYCFSRLADKRYTGLLGLVFFVSVATVVVIVAMHYTLYATIAVAAAVFASPFVMYGSKTAQSTRSFHVPYVALVLAALFLTGAHEITTLFEARFDEPVEAMEPVHFDVLHRTEYSVAYPEAWLASRTGTSTTFQRRGAQEWDASFLVMPEDPECSSGKISVEYCAESAVGGGSAVETSWTGSSTDPRREFVMPAPDSNESIHLWIWERQTKGGTWAMYAFAPDKYSPFFAELYESMAKSWEADGSTTAPEPLSINYSNTALRVGTFGLLPLALLPAGLALIYFPQLRVRAGKVFTFLKYHLGKIEKQTDSKERGFANGDRRNVGLFAVLVATTSFFFLPRGTLTEFFGSVPLPDNPFAALQLFVAVGTIMALILFYNVNTVRNSRLLSELLELNIGMGLLEVAYRFYSAAGEIGGKSLKLQAVFFLLLLIWDLLMSGKEITNGDSKVFRRANRVLLYAGYLVLVSSAILYYACQTGGPNALLTDAKFFDSENTIREGILWLGAPLLMTGYLLRVRQRE